MNGPPASCCIDAVPSRTIRPSAVTGRDVPGRTPAIAASTDEVPGRADGPRFRVRVVDGVAEAKAGGDSRPTVNEQLVERGLARVPGASKHAADDLAVAMRALQLGARAARAGVWRYGDCDFSDDEK